ncbi:MAG TPA: hypothetical protein VN174_01220 [Candidatus Methanoperedens sp.]|nr:hypothetical protein [Candidatus Methanoperedens sp.]
MANIKLSPFGAYLTSWTIDGREVLYQGSELKRTGIPLLFPNFDFGPPLPNHGFGRISNWQVIKNFSNSCHLRLTDGDISSEYREIYPYKFIADLKISANNNQLDYYLEVKNLSPQNLPLSPGLHPYWPVKHDKKTNVKIKNFPEFNPTVINWNKNPPNYNYSFSGYFEVDFPDYQLSIREVDEGNVNFHNLQIWSQNTSMPDYNFICFEPVCRPQNGINTNPILVPPNKTEKFHLIFEVTFQ